MYNRVSHTRAALLGVLFAMVGFSFALATSRGLSDASDVAVASREVGSNPLQFTNPQLGGGDYDLGDVAVGSSFVRYARATGGVRPYTFVASNAAPTVKTALGTSNATISVLADGTVVGSMGNLAVSASPVRFTIMVSDSFGTAAHTLTGVFRLTLDNSGTFKFATDTLATGVQFQPYLDNLQVLNGAGTLSFTVTGVQVDGKDTANKVLEDVGLSLSPVDGTIFGKPFVSGVVTFTANCADAKGNQAKSRDLSQVGQKITLPVTANTLVASDIIATSIQVKVGPVGSGKDSVKYAGVANLAGRTVASLSGKALVVKIGSYTSPNTAASPAVLDEKGKISKPAKGVASKTSPKVTGSVNSTGSIKFSTSNDTVGLTLPATGTKGMAVSVQVGDAVSGSQFLVFTLKGSSKSTTASYKFTGVDDKAGEFMLTSVQGKDDKKSDADSWKVGFIATAPGANTFGGLNNVNVSIGKNFTQAVAVTEDSKGKVKSTIKAKSSDVSVTKLSMDAAKGKGQLTTGYLPSAQTNIQQAAKATGNSTFALNLTGTVGGVAKYAGEGAVVIYPSKTSWTTKQPK